MLHKESPEAHNFSQQSSYRLALQKANDSFLSLPQPSLKDIKTYFESSIKIQQDFEDSLEIDYDLALEYCLTSWEVDRSGVYVHTLDQLCSDFSPSDRDTQEALIRCGLFLVEHPLVPQSDATSFKTNIKESHSSLRRQKHNPLGRSYFQCLVAGLHINASLFYPELAQDLGLPQIRDLRTTLHQNLNFLANDFGYVH